MSEQKESGFFRDTLKPVVVLIAICLTVSALLGVTNEITKPLILANKEEQALRDRQELLPDATGFREEEYPADDHVTGIFVDNGGSGVIVSVEMTGYGGIVATTVGIDGSGRVLGLRVSADTETKGIGSKVAEPAFTELFAGAESVDGIDLISGATYSSRTVIDSVALALEAFQSVKGA